MTTTMTTTMTATMTTTITTTMTTSMTTTMTTTMRKMTSTFIRPTTIKEDTLPPLSTVQTGIPTTDEKSSLSLSSIFTTKSTTKKSVSEAEKEKEEAEAAKEEAEEALEEAEETAAAAEEASSTTSSVNEKISELIGTSSTLELRQLSLDEKKARHKRDITSNPTTVAYETPESCA